MAAAPKPSPGAPHGAEGRVAVEDRRDSVRVDDRVLLEYWPAARAADAAEGADHLRRFGQIPLAGSLETPDGPPLNPLVVQWMSKIEWTLDAILRTLEHQCPTRVTAPRLMDVNVCGDGIRFLPYRPLSLGDRIDLRMVLPPFIVVEARGEVIQARPDSGGLDPAHTVVVRFVDMAESEREKIVRYVFQRQTEMQRRRQRAPT